MFRHITHLSSPVTIHPKKGFCLYWKNNNRLGLLVQLHSADMKRNDWTLWQNPEPQTFFPLLSGRLLLVTLERASELLLWRDPNPLRETLIDVRPWLTLVASVYIPKFPKPTTTSAFFNCVPTIDVHNVEVGQGRTIVLVEPIRQCL